MCGHKEKIKKRASLKITRSSQKNTCVREPLSNTAKCLQAVRFATLLKRNPRTGVLESAIHKCSLKKVFLNNSQNSYRKTPVLESLFK